MNKERSGFSNQASMESDPFAIPVNVDLELVKLRSVEVSSHATHAATKVDMQLMQIHARKNLCT
ncbi:hypothetical protein V6Z12_A08G144300 [Gossypium hirsutum]